MIDTEVIVDAAELASLRDEWDALATANAQPMSLPAWMLGWLRHLAPPHTRLRAIAARERGRLIGLAPMFVVEGEHGRVDYRMLGGPLPRTSPLAIAGREWEVADVVAAALAEADPRPDAIALESAPAASVWPVALRENWPSRARPLLRQYFVQGSPTLCLRHTSFEAWLSRKGSSFRRDMRRNRRAFEAIGGVSRQSTPETLAADIEAFLQLHAMRWENRGVSDIVARGPAMSRMLLEVGEAELAGGRFRLQLLEVEGRAVAAQLCAAAGGEVLLFNSGWDERYARFGPAMLAILDVIEDSFARGDRRIDFAPGEQPNKLRFADGTDPVAWTLLLVPGRRLPITYARTAPMLAGSALRASAKRALPVEQVDRLRVARRRFHRHAEPAPVDH